MSGLINLIKSLFSGIFGFLGGLFGGKKAIAGNASNGKKGKGYFLELDEASIPVVKAEVTDTKAETKTETLPAAEQPMTVSTEAIADAVAASPEAKSAAKSAKKSTRKEKLATLAGAESSASAAGDAKAAAEAPVPAQPKPAVTSAPVSETAFATKYLIPENNGSRRRPGANMSSYLNMARNIKTAS